MAESLDPGRLRDKLMEEIVVKLAVKDPKRAEEVVRSIQDSGERYVVVTLACRALGRSDPKRAAAMIDLIDNPRGKSHAWLFLGESLASTDKAGAVAAFRRAELEMAKLGDDQSNSIINGIAITLPLVEAIDPSLVAETLWRTLSLRRSTFDPRKSMGVDQDSFALPMTIARYDREIAATLFEPTLALARRAAKNADQLDYPSADVALTIDPKITIELVESIPPAKTFDFNERANSARINISELLGLDNAARWRLIWRRSTGIGLLMYQSP